MEEVFLHFCSVVIICAPPPPLWNMECCFSFSPHYFELRIKRGGRVKREYSKGGWSPFYFVSFRTIISRGTSSDVVWRGRGPRKGVIEMNSWQTYSEKFWKYYYICTTVNLIWGPLQIKSWPQSFCLSFCSVWILV